MSVLTELREALKCWPEGEWDPEGGGRFVATLELLRREAEAGTIEPGMDRYRTLEVFEAELERLKRKGRRLCAEQQTAPPLELTTLPAERVAYISPDATYYDDQPPVELAEGQKLQPPWQWFGTTEHRPGDTHEVAWLSGGHRYYLTRRSEQFVRGRLKRARASLPSWWPDPLRWRAILHGTLTGFYRPRNPTSGRIDVSRFWALYPIYQQVEAGWEGNPTGEAWVYDREKGVARPVSGSAPDGRQPHRPTGDTLPPPPPNGRNGNGGPGPIIPPGGGDPIVDPFDPSPPPQPFQPDRPGRPSRPRMPEPQIPPPPDRPTRPGPDTPPPPDRPAGGGDGLPAWALAGGGLALLVLLGRRRRNRR